MIRLLTILAMLVTMTSVAQAQFYRTQYVTKKGGAKMMITPVVGTQLIDIKYGNDEKMQGMNVEQAQQMGISAGLAMTMPLDENFFDFNSGLLYSYANHQTRLSRDNSDGDLEAIINTELHRLSLPLGLSFFPFRKRNGIYMKAGVVGQYFLQGQQETVATFNSKTSRLESYQRTQTDAIEKGAQYKDFSLDGLVAVGFAARGSYGIGIQAEVAYQPGLTDLNDARTRIDSMQAILGLNFSF
ncbi:MAG: outer membrane beta-barrel protein [Bdellovibrionales bacterium]|nr:outer membrane beta-barrel protein [Bdellovibrionales bacterium]